METLIAEFESTGMAIVRGVFSPDECNQMQRRVREIAQAPTATCCPCVYHPDGSLHQAYAAHENEAVFSSAAHDSRVLERVWALLGDEIYVWHSKLNFKVPHRGLAWQWHQDYGYWQAEGVRPAMISVAILVDRVLPENGALLFAPMTHRLGLLPHVLDRQSGRLQRTISPESLAKTLQSAPAVLFTGEPGDLVLFDCLTLHASLAQTSAHHRTIFFVAYNRLDNLPRADLPATRPEWIVARNAVPLRRAERTYRGSPDLGVRP